MGKMGKAGELMLEMINAVRKAVGKSARILGNQVDKLLKAGNVVDRGGYTLVGRALQKHGSRPRSVFPKVTGNPDAFNKAGEEVLKKILTDPDLISSIRHHARFGKILECKVPGGYGARFSSDGKTFIGFIEP